MGRIITITLLSMAVAMIGRMEIVPRAALELLSGVFLLVFGDYLAATGLFGWAPPWKNKPHSHLNEPAVLPGFTFSAAVGIVFGIHPALRAASLESCDALRAI